MFEEGTFSAILGMANDIGSVAESASKVVGSVRNMLRRSQASGDPELIAALVSLSAQIEDARAANRELNAEIMQLHDRVRAFQAEIEPFQVYAFHETKSGSWVYKLKSPNKSDPRPRFACISCKNKRVFSPLERGDGFLRCQECGKITSTLSPKQQKEHAEKTIEKIRERSYRLGQSRRRF